MATLLACTLLVALPVLAGDKVNINTATVAELQSIKGIGPKTASAIVAYRTEHGGFKSINELENVKGIGSKSLEKFEGELTVSKK